MQTKRKQREIKHLKHLRAEYIEDSAFWYVQGDYAQHLRSVMRALDINHQIIARRKRFF